MDKEDYRKKKLEIDTIAARYMWSVVSNDEKSGRLSYQDELSVYKVDVFTSKMTVCILPKGGQPVYLKRQNMVMVDKVLKNPYKY
ncbi:MAG TPA: hypothetical protein DCL77_14410 [Prolixibacteraceae bacterium]|jgi:hypothetical protein|nr:hypothetical protein [Prolixibacteraceae bacterium]